MLHLLETMANKKTRARIGARIEILTDESFQLIRWTLIVGFARYLSDAFPQRIFDLLYWGLTGLLFAYLVSRFLLRPEIRLVPNPKQRWQRLLQTLANMMLCVLIFALVLWGVGQLTAAIADYRSAM